MKRFVFVFVMLLVFGCMCFAESPATNKIEAFIGAGHIWTGGGNAYSLDSNASLQLQAGVTYTINNWYLETSLHSDTLKVSNWLLEHNFLDKVVASYEYRVLDVGGGYIFSPNNKIQIRTGLFVSQYFSPNKDVDSKTGIKAEVKTVFFFTDKVFGYVGLAYRHTEDFIAPQVNVVETSYGIGYRF